MIHAPEWIPAWRLKQAYSLTEADILSLVQSLGEHAHISLHPAWGMMEEYFLKPQTEAMPEHWRSTLDGIFDDTGAANSPSWIVRAFNERDRLYQSLIIVAVHADDDKFSDAVITLFESVYEGEPAVIPSEIFCAPFLIPNGGESSRLFSQIFHESLLFNKYAAVETLEKAHYPLITEVKGITKDFVKTVSSTIQQLPSLPSGFKDNSIPATDYRKSFAWLQERWGSIQLEDVAVILWKHEIRPSRISSSPGSITGFPPESFYTMGSLTGEDSEEKKMLFYIDQRQVEKLEREHPDFAQITDEDRQKYREAITPITPIENLAYSGTTQGELTPPATNQMPRVKNRVSTAGSGNTQVKNTCRENEEAFTHIQNIRQQNQEGFGDLIPELLQEVVNAGGSTAVAGCLIFPDSASVAVARDAAKYRLKKATER